MHHGLIERLQALQGGGAMLGSGAEMIKQAGVRGLESGGLFFPQLLGEVFADQRMGIHWHLAGFGAWGEAARLHGWEAQLQQMGFF